MLSSPERLPAPTVTGQLPDIGERTQLVALDCDELLERHLHAVGIQASRAPEGIDIHIQVSGAPGVSERYASLLEESLNRIFDCPTVQPRRLCVVSKVLDNHVDLSEVSEILALDVILSDDGGYARHSEDQGSHSVSFQCFGHGCQYHGLVENSP